MGGAVGNILGTGGGKTREIVREQAPVNPNPRRDKGADTSGTQAATEEQRKLARRKRVQAQTQLSERGTTLRSGVNVISNDRPTRSGVSIQ